MGLPSGVSDPGPSCSSSASKVASSDARTWISSVKLRIWLSTAGAAIAVLMASPVEEVTLDRVSSAFPRRALDAQQLMLPEALEGLGPFVQRADGGGAGALAHPAALA